MIKTTDQILTTHVGSMPRSQEVADLLFAQDAGELDDLTEFNRAMGRAVAESAKQQVEAGVDIISDGEMSKISYATYIRHRLSGFEIGDAPRATPADLDDFPGFRDRLASAGGTPTYHRPVCRGPISVKDLQPLRTDIEHLKKAAARAGAREAFMNAASPGVIAVFQPNEYYASHEHYLEALSAAMKSEYEEIVLSGLILQVDCPDLAMGRHIRFRDADEAEFLRNANLQVEALNAALENVPSESVRLHLCWGNYEGPHTHDIPLRSVLPVVLKAKAQAILFESANPRHAHEWQAWKDADVPDDTILVPGVIDTTTNFVEHPELVAQRLARFISIVGKERVIAGTDCGFGTFAGYGAIHPSICWAKLCSLADGARIASVTT